MSTPCDICGSTDETVSSGLCDGCWYGMRMEPEEWAARLKAQGIEVVHQGGCLERGGAIVCRNPYRRA